MEGGREGGRREGGREGGREGDEKNSFKFFVFLPLVDEENLKKKKKVRARAHTHTSIMRCCESDVCTAYAVVDILIRGGIE
jgi:hypothetical protein